MNRHDLIVLFLISALTAVLACGVWIYHPFSSALDWISAAFLGMAALATALTSFHLTSRVVIIGGTVNALAFGGRCLFWINHDLHDNKPVSPRDVVRTSAWLLLAVTMRVVWHSWLLPEAHQRERNK